MPIVIGHYAGLGMDFGRVLLRVLHFPIGAFCSLSGGAFLVTGIGVGWFSWLPLRRIWFLLLMLGALGVFYIESFSNRGTLAILATAAATDGDSAWYRLRLPGEVFRTMEGHWWTGFGREKPDMPGYNDITNHYLWWLLQAGLPCMVAFIALFVVAFNRLYRSTQHCVGAYLRWLNWGLAASLLGLGLGMMTVALFGQMRTYLFLFFALAACSLSAARAEEAELAEASITPLIPVPVAAVEPCLEPQVVGDTGGWIEDRDG
jgi:hypothetical protein